MDQRERNRILSVLDHDDWHLVSRHTEPVVLPVGHVLYRAGDAVTHAYFPCTGLIATFGVLQTGDHVATITTGAEGVLGWAPIVGIDTAPHESRIKVALTGYRMPVPALQQAFDDSIVLRRLILRSMGHALRQIAGSGVCNRFHSQRQRVARWLVVITGKTGQMSLPITHEQLAHMVGGPRHAVTELIAEFRGLGILQHARGSIEILERDRLAAIACDCYLTDLNPFDAQPIG